MKRTLLFVLLVSIPLFTQSNRSLTWEKLAECLPQIQTVSDLIRAEVSGDNDPNAYVSLLYYNSHEIMERSKEIHINLDDCSTQPENIEEALTEAPDISEPILIKGKYKGIKIISVNDSIVEYCTYHVSVAGKFLITISSTTEGDFTEEIEILIDNFDFGKLESML